MTRQAKKQQVEFNEAVHGDRLKDLIKNASDIKTEIEAGNDALRDTRKLAKEELGVDGKMFNALLRIYHKDQREKFESENEQVVDVYDAVFN